MSEVKFEVSMKRLEEIVAILENGKADLDESLKLYEEGLLLSKSLQQQLTSFEEKINILNKQDLEGVNENE